MAATTVNVYDATVRQSPSERKPPSHASAPRPTPTAGDGAIRARGKRARLPPGEHQRPRGQHRRAEEEPGGDEQRGFQPSSVLSKTTAET